MTETAARLIDTHLHQWDLDQCAYDWLNADLPPAFHQLRRTFLVDEAQEHFEATGATEAVLVQAENSLADTEAMLAVSRSDDRVVAVVGWVDLLDPEGVPDTLDSLRAAGPLVGIRHLIHDEPDPDWVLQPAVSESLGILAQHGMAYDFVGVTLRHLQHVPTLAEAVGDLHIVIDHLNKPPISTDDYPRWVELMSAAAGCSNVFAKVSGLHNVTPHADWTTEDLRGAFEVALEAFGSERLMFGSDWPVCNVGGGYRRQHKAFEELLAPLDAGAAEDLRWRSACRAYGLN
ncbi:MAG: amidohydrolase family protein [Acidimicrobiia bacterium]|nr:amidohydrolase family protein [Acidimicrobiia bacterium]